MIWRESPLTKALVRDLIVQGVGPERRVAHGGSDGAVVDKAELSHHEELSVPAHTEEGDSHAPDVLHVDPTEPVDDVCLADHLIKPVLNGGVGAPPLLGAPVGDAVHGDLVSLVPQLLHHGVVAVLVRDVERPVDWTAVRIFVAWREEFVLVEVPVLVVNSIVEGDCYHLWDVCGQHSPGYQGAVRGTETRGQSTVTVVTGRGSVRVVLRVTPALV